MMAQEMYEENQVLESEIESIKSLLNDIDDFLKGCNPQSAEEDRRIGNLQERIRSIDDDHDEDDYEPEFKCDDCCHPDGTPRKGIGCACGKNDDDYDGDDND